LIQMLYLQSSNAFLNPKNQRGIWDMSVPSPFYYRQNKGLDH
jgi:hypothetical protein